jgi:hypothetical protein
MAAGPQLIKQEAECKGFPGSILCWRAVRRPLRSCPGRLLQSTKTIRGSALNSSYLAGLELKIISRESAEALPPLTYQVFASRSSVGTVSLRAARSIAVPWLALAAWRWRGQSEWAARLTAALNQYRPDAVRHAGHADMAPDPGVVGNVPTEVCRRSPCLLQWTRTPLTGCSLVYRVSGRSVRTAWTTCSIAALVSCA